jgi:hypothetical protein
MLMQEINKFLQSFDNNFKETSNNEIDTWAYLYSIF